MAQNSSKSFYSEGTCECLEHDGLSGSDHGSVLNIGSVVIKLLCHIGWFRLSCNFGIVLRLDSIITILWLLMHSFIDSLLEN